MAETYLTKYLKNALGQKAGDLYRTLGIPYEEISVQEEYPVVIPGQKKANAVDMVFSASHMENGYLCTNVICLELKISDGDMRTHHGMNFFGNENFAVVPEDLYDNAVRFLKRINREDVGILVYHNGGTYEMKKPTAYVLYDPSNAAAIYLRKHPYPIDPQAFLKSFSQEWQKADVSGQDHTFFGIENLYTSSLNLMKLRREYLPETLEKQLETC